MKIGSRPYHPYIISYFASGGKADGLNEVGMNEVVDKVRRYPDLEVEFVEEYDDICRKCDRHVADPRASVWGRRHTCPSAQRQEVVDGVNKASQRVLGALSFRFTCRLFIMNPYLP